MRLVPCKTIPFNLGLIYFKGEMIMSKNDEILELTKEVDNKLKRLIALIKTHIIKTNIKKGDK